MPIFLGGDHLVSLPLLRAVAGKYGRLALVHFDSHSDLWHGDFGGKDTHGTLFRRALEEELIDPARSSQIGLRSSGYDIDILKPTIFIQPIHGHLIAIAHPGYQLSVGQRPIAFQSL